MAGKRKGGCACGRVRYDVEGEPVRVGLCHCTTCRLEGGSLFSAFAVWPRDRFAGTGETREWEGRSFCPVCGSRLYELTDREAEIHLGTLDDAPNGLRPVYELWIKRREPWMEPVAGASQHVENRPKAEGAG